MFRTTQEMTYTETIAKAMVDGRTTLPVAAPFALTDVQLYTNVFTPSPQMVIGDFTEATFGGYAAVAALVWLGPVNINPTKYAMQVTVNFLATDPIGTPETVLGYYMVDAGGVVVRAAEEFVDSVSFAEGGDFLSLDLILPLEALAVPAG